MADELIPVGDNGKSVRYKEQPDGTVAEIINVGGSVQMQAPSGGMAVTGTVNVGTMPPVAVSGTVPVSGAVAVTAMPAVTGAVAVTTLPAVTGTVAVSTLPAITGAVEVTSMPPLTVGVLPPVSGAVAVTALPNVTGSMAVTSLPSVDVASLPSITGTVNVTGTAACLVADGMDMTQGAKGDAAASWFTSTSSVIGMLKLIAAGLLDLGSHVYGYDNGNLVTDAWTFLGTTRTKTYTYAGGLLTAESDWV